MQSLKMVAVAGGMTLALAGASEAAFTAVSGVGSRDFSPGSERCLAGVDDTGTSIGKCTVGSAAGTYDGKQSILDIIQLDLGKTLTRVDDGLDKIWLKLTSDPDNVRSRARYADDSSDLGFGTAPGGYTLILGTLPDGKVAVESGASCVDIPGDCVVGPIGWSSLGVPLATPFWFVLDNKTFGQRITSDTSVGGYSNSGSASDWMVTYKVNTGDPLDERYVIAWEDRFADIDAAGRPNDWDYNDYVFELRFLAPAVPEPGSMILLGTGLLGVGRAFRRRRQDAQMQ